MNPRRCTHDARRNSAGACVTCVADYQKKYRREHREQYQKAGKERRARARAKAIAMLGGKCADCPITDERVLEFDHLRDKTINVSTLFGKTWSRIEEELRKCELVCANCHRIRTANRRSS